MADIRLKTITVESSPLIIRNGIIDIKSKLISNGGISILNSSFSFSTTAGGSLTVHGGSSVNKNFFINSNLFLEKESIFSINDILLIDQTNFHKTNSILLNNNNVSIGSLNVSGGVSVNSLNNSSLNIFGGSSVQKKIFSNSLTSPSNNTIGSLLTKDSKIWIDSTNITSNSRLNISHQTIGNKIVLYNDCSFSINHTDLNYNTPTDQYSHVFYSNGINGNFESKELLCITGDGFVGINKKIPSVLLDINGEFGFKYKNYHTTSTSLLKKLQNVIPSISFQKISNLVVNDIYWSNKLNTFLAINNSNLYTSPDSINWNSIPLPPVPINYTIQVSQKSKLIWIPELELFLLFSIYNNSLSSQTDLIIHYTSDLVTWNYTIITQISTFYSMSWSPDLNTCITILKNINGEVVIYKTQDGINWNNLIHGIIGLKNIFDICWSSEQHTFIGIGQLSNNNMCSIISYDGILWSLYEHSSYVSQYGYRIIWCQDRGIFCSLITDDNNYKIITSTDGTTWNTSYTTSSIINDINYSFDSNVFIIITNTTILQSYNTYQWTPVSISNNVLNTIYWSRDFSKFVILSNSSIYNSNILYPSNKNTLLVLPNILSINYTTGNIGIKNINPTYSLHINNNINASGDLLLTDLNNNNISVQNTNTENLYLLNSSISEKINTINIVSTNISCNNLLSNSIKSHSVKILNTITNTLYSNQIYSNQTFFQKIHVSNNGTLGSFTFNDQNTTLNINGNSKISQNGLSNNCIVSGGVSTKNLNVRGGMHVKKTIYITEQSSFQNTVSIKGGVEIKTPLNGMTILGGLAISKDLYVGGSLFTGILHTLSINITNIANDSLLCSGGITINNYTNSLNISNGGCLTVNGGSVVEKDIFITKQIIKKSKYISQTTAFAKKTSFIHNNNELYSFNTQSDNLILSKNNSNILQFKNFQIHFDNTEHNSILFKGNVLMTNLHNNGDISVKKSISINEDSLINSVTQSITHNDGSLVVKGGVSINKNLGVTQNVVVLGKLNASSTLTDLDSTKIQIADNLTILKPQNTQHTGIIFKRYQLENDNAVGDVVNEKEYISFVLEDQTLLGDLSTPTNTVLLPLQASNITDFYKGWWIKVNSGFRAGQTRKIVSYNGSTKIATVSSYWNVSNPSIGDNILVYNKPFVGLIFNTTDKIFEFVNTNYDFNDITPNTYQTLKSNNIITQRNIILSGGLSVNNTSNSNSLSGGGLTTIGGGSIQKTIHVNGNLYVNNALYDFIENDVINSEYYISNSLTNIINGIILEQNKSFDLYIATRIIKSTHLNNYCFFHIRGINIDSEWIFTKTYVGDDIGITFNINNQNKVEYTLPPISNFSNIEFKYKLFTV